MCVVAIFAVTLGVALVATLAAALGAPLAANLETALRTSFALKATFDAVFGAGFGGDFLTFAAVDFATVLPFGTFDDAAFVTLLTALDFDFAFAVTNFHSPKATC